LCTQSMFALVTSKKPKTPSQKTWRPTVDDIKLLAELKAQLGVVNETDVIRMGLRALAAKEARATNG